MFPIPKGEIGELIVEKYFSLESATYNTETYELKMIADYLKISILDVYNMSYEQYLYYKKEAWIYTQQQSEQGREFLKELYQLQQTAGDYEKISKVSVK